MGLQIFISWSGEPSREVAENLSSFVRHVVRGAETFVSTQDIDAGERWEARLSQELERTHVAILCVTKDNQRSPWLNYEAGALGKTLGCSRVIPFTIGFRPGELMAGPLSRLQGVANDEAGTWALVRTLNRSHSKPADEQFVREDFELWWPRLARKLAEVAVEQARPELVVEPSDREILLELRRDLSQVMKQLVKPLPPTCSPSSGPLAETDELTRLPNQRAFIQRARMLHDANAKLVMAFIDLDNFKQVNDKLGHKKGDELLVWIADELRRHLHYAIMVARIGGDEFAALFRDVSSEHVSDCVMRFIAQLSDHMRKAGYPPLTASVGVSTGAGKSLDDMLRDADRAMYGAKNTGGGRVNRAP